MQGGLAEILLCRPQMRADGGLKMRYGAAVARRLGNFGQDRSGSFAVMMAAVMAVLALSAGYAVNIAQLYNVRAEIKQALDAAVTSTARDITSGKIKADDARDWVERTLRETEGKTFAIVVREGERLIGSVSLMDINHRHGVATLGIASTAIMWALS